MKYELQQLVNGYMGVIVMRVSTDQINVGYAMLCCSMLSLAFILCCKNVSYLSLPLTNFGLQTEGAISF